MVFLEQAGRFQGEKDLNYFTFGRLKTNRHTLKTVKWNRAKQVNPGI